MIVNNVEGVQYLPSPETEEADSGLRYLCALLLALVLATFAQAQQRWTRTYGGVWGEYGRSVQQTADSGYVVAGYTESYGAGYTDFYLVKTNGYGDTIWTRTYGDTGYQSAYVVRQTADRGYVMTGVTMPPAGTGFDVRVVKTSVSGGAAWTKTYGGPSDDQGRDIRQTADGGCIVVGCTRSFGSGMDDIMLIKMTGSGDSVWIKAIGGFGSDIGCSVLETPDQGYVIAGLTSDIGGLNEDVYLVKTSPSGDTVWTRRYGGTGDDEGLCVDQTADGGYIITGLAHLPGPGDISLYLVRTNGSGDTLWTRTYGGPYHDVGNSVQQTSDGGYIIAGTTYRSVGDADAYLIRTDSLGDTLWTRFFGGTGVDGGSSVRQTLDGGYIVSGRTTSFGAGNGDIWLIKTDANGSAAVAEAGGGRPKASGDLDVVPNPFTSSARVPGHEAERFEVHDASGRRSGTYPGNRLGEGLPPAVYFVRAVAEHGRSVRVVKTASGQ